MPPDCAVNDVALSERIASIHGASRQTYGASQVDAKLADEVVSIGRKGLED